MSAVPASALAESVSPALVEDDPTLSIPKLLAERAYAHPELTIIERKLAMGGGWVPVTAAGFWSEVREIGRGLIATGVHAGDRVSIMSRTRYEWTLLDFAIWSIGAVPVPVYETSSVEQIQWILSDAGVSVAFVETASLAELTRAAHVPGVDAVFVIEDGFSDLVADGNGERHRELSAELEARLAAQRADDVATIIYTSGTTGRPKGVELTHGNFLHLVRNGVHALHAVCAEPHSRTLLFMPLAHVFARFVEVLCITSAGVLGHTPDLKNLISDLGTFSPTFLLAVPRVFEKVYNSAEQKAGGGVKLRLFHWAARVAIAHSRARDIEGGSSVALTAQYALASRLVLSKLQTSLGGALEYAISGGAPLGERLGHFFRGVGVTVLEGYGLTETTAPTSVNHPASTKIGTVGPAYPGTAIRVDDTGEILVKGAHVFRGYRNNAEATAQAFEDGWFRTGDLGSIDADGFLTITGRKKEIIVTAGGKNVAPALLEDRLRSHPLISQVVVLGEGKPFISALVTLDVDMLPGWLAAHGLGPLSLTKALREPKVVASIDRAVQRTNQAVSRAESIRKFVLLGNDFTEANGYLTPSMKVRRTLVLEDFADVVEGLYASGEDAVGHDVGATA